MGGFQDDGRPVLLVLRALKLGDLLVAVPALRGAASRLPGAPARSMPRRAGSTRRSPWSAAMNCCRPTGWTSPCPCDPGLWT